MLPPALLSKADNVLDNFINTLDVGFSIMDKELTVIWANNSLSQILNLRQDPVGRKCYDVFQCECKDTNSCSVMQTLASGEKRYSEIKLITEKGERIYIKNISVPLKDEEDKIIYILKLTIDITEKEEQVRQLSLLRKLSELMHSTLDTDKLLHLILTCTTAGSGLGFNRARLFLVDKERKVVCGKLAVGPSSPEEANRIWNEISNKYEKLEDLIKVSEYNYYKDTPLNTITRLMVYSLEDEKEVIVSCIKNKRTILVKDVFNNPDINKEFANMIGANEFVCVPLMVKDEAIGLICADNIYNRKPITEENLQLLSTFANQAAIAINNAEIYSKLKKGIQQLEDTQKRLIQSERLAIIGNMAAYIAHEIRNPLVTIGGFARAILRDASEQIKKKASIIVDEVDRLEKILTNIMDFSKSTGQPQTKMVTQINELVEDTCSLMDAYFKKSCIYLNKKLNTSLPRISVDPGQIKQLLLNLIKNAVESMPGGGTLTIETSIEGDNIKINVTDTGEGISPELIPEIFNPFFTTKANGTGVGLAVSQKIVENHKGYIKVESTLNKGSTFSIFLPVKRVIAE